MKTILFLFSFMFVSSCVTANPEGRDLSAVNTAEDENTKIAFNWKFWERNTPKPEDAQNKPLEEIEYNYKLEHCLNDCRNNPCDYSYRNGCNICYKWHGKTHTKESIKVASIGDQNPFNLLKESQSNFEQMSTSQDKNHKDKAPLMLADDYDDCMCDCIANGGSPGVCNEVCY